MFGVTERQSGLARRRPYPSLQIMIARTTRCGVAATWRVGGTDIDMGVSER